MKGGFELATRRAQCNCGESVSRQLPAGPTSRQHALHSAREANGAALETIVGDFATGGGVGGLMLIGSDPAFDTVFGNLAIATKSARGRSSSITMLGKLCFGAPFGFLPCGVARRVAGAGCSTRSCRSRCSGTLHSCHWSVWFMMALSFRHSV